MTPRRDVLMLAALLPVAARAQAAPEILVRFPNGTFLENLVVAPDGSVLFTNYFARRIEAWSPVTGATLHAEVPAHPVSLTPLGAGWQALAVHGASFMEGPAAMRGQAAVLVLAPDGAVVRRVPLPEAIFPNGALLLAPGLLLLADSGLGRIWIVDLETRAARPWLDDPSLAPVEGRPLPGVNGIKRSGPGALLVSNSARRTLLRIGLDGLIPRGAPEQVAAMAQGVDDFAVAPDGTVFAATHAEGIARLAPGAATPVLIPAPGLEGSTAVAFAPDRRSLLALGTGGLLEGGRGEAVLARLVP